MKKIVALLIFAACLIACLRVIGKGHRWPKTDVGKGRLNGNVRSVEETRCGIDEKGNKESNCRTSVDKFTADGKILEMASYGISNDPQLAPGWKYVYRYDGSWNLIEEYRSERDSIVSRTVNSHFVNGKCLNSITYEGGKIVSKDAYVYDARGNNLVNSRFTAHDSLLERTVSVYDKSDNLVADSTFDTNGMLTWATLHKYDSYDNELESDVFHAARGTHTVTKTKYDESGYPVETNNYFKDRFSHGYTQNYEQIDPKGNWLVQKEYDHGKLQYITERTITYW